MKKHVVRMNHMLIFRCVHYFSGYNVNVCHKFNKMNTGRKLKLYGLLCRCLSAERMFCGGLDPLLMKTDLWR